MNYNDFIKETKRITRKSVNKANRFLNKIDLSLSINWEYDSWKYNDLSSAIGVYEGGSVFGGEIIIGFNLKNLYESFEEETSMFPNSNPNTILNEIIQTNVYHEMGHGIIEQINDYLTETDELDGIYDQNQELFDYVLGDEEDAVESFAWDFYDGMLNDNDLYAVIKLVYNQ